MVSGFPGNPSRLPATVIGTYNYPAVVMSITTQGVSGSLDFTGTVTNQNTISGGIGAITMFFSRQPN